MTTVKKIKKVKKVKTEADLKREREEAAAAAAAEVEAEWESYVVDFVGYMVAGDLDFALDRITTALDARLDTLGLNDDTNAADDDDAYPIGSAPVYTNTTNAVTLAAPGRLIQPGSTISRRYLRRQLTGACVALGGPNLDAKFYRLRGKRVNVTNVNRSTVDVEWVDPPGTGKWAFCRAQSFRMPYNLLDIVIVP